MTNQHSDATGNGEGFSTCPPTYEDRTQTRQNVNRSSDPPELPDNDDELQTLDFESEDKDAENLHGVEPDEPSDEEKVEEIIELAQRLAPLSVEMSDEVGFLVDSAVGVLEITNDQGDLGIDTGRSLSVEL